jgi:8-amino-7-oxononanoate synthase
VDYVQPAREHHDSLIFHHEMLNEKDILEHLNAALSRELAELATNGLIRSRRKLESPCGRHVTVDGNVLLNFASNDYLGLAHHSDIANAIAEGALHWGSGSGASHLVSGHLEPHDRLELQIAKFVGFEKALTFSTGYLANLAVTPTFAGRGAAIFADKLNHASLIDAMQLAKANGALVHRYAHNNVQHLEKLLAGSTAPTKLIVTDSVFSMDGDLAHLPELLQLAEQFDAWLIVDDAHGFGVLGPHGEGALAHFNLPASPRILLMGTLGKSAGVGGAFVAGSALAMEYLLQKGRSYIFTTAAPPAMACGLSSSLSLIEEGNALRAQLQRHIQALQHQLGPLPANPLYRLLPSQTAIQAFIVGENSVAVELSQSLWECGIWVPAIRPPTVPSGTARLRISLSAAHTDEDIELLVSRLKGFL